MSAQPGTPAVAVARAHVEAWSNHDFDTARSMLADDVRITATSTDPALPGADLTGAGPYMEGLIAYAQPIVHGSVTVLASTGNERNALLTLTMKMAGGPFGAGVTAPCACTSWTRTTRSSPNGSSSTSRRTESCRTGDEFIRSPRLYPRGGTKAATREGVIVVTGSRADALARLDVFVGEWVVEARFPAGGAPSGPAGNGPQVRSRFEWVLEGQFLLQRTEVPVPEAPGGLMIVSADPETGAYTQHYYDSRGVVRLYAMTFADGVWTLTRESPDFTPLDFRQRFTGTFGADGNTISGAWESGRDGGEWEHDFALTYRRAD